MLLQNNDNRNADLPGKLITFGHDKNNPQIWGLFYLLYFCVNHQFATLAPVE